MSATAPPRRPRRETPGPSALPEPDSALIEEARRRARRRRLGYVAIVALAALGVGLFLALHNGGDGPARHGRTPAGAGPKPAPQAGRQQDETVFAATPKIVGEAGLAAPGVGWAINGLGLYWTRDDGLHGRLITPPSTSRVSTRRLTAGRPGSRSPSFRSTARSYSPASDAAGPWAPTARPCTEPTTAGGTGSESSSRRLSDMWASGRLSVRHEPSPAV